MCVWVCVYMCICKHGIAHVWSSEYSLQKSVLSSTTWASGLKQLTGLCETCVYFLSNLSKSMFILMLKIRASDFNFIFQKSPMSILVDI